MHGSLCWLQHYPSLDIQDGLAGRIRKKPLPRILRIGQLRMLGRILEHSGHFPFECKIEQVAQQDDAPVGGASRRTAGQVSMVVGLNVLKADFAQALFDDIQPWVRRQGRGFAGFGSG